MRLSGEEFNHLEQLSARPEYAHYGQVTVMIQRQPSNNR